MKVFFLALISMFFLFQMVFGQANPKRFSIYLLPGKIKNDQLASLNLKTLKPDGKPLVEISDISSYLKDTHEIRFNYTGADKLKRLGSSLKGKPFVVFVNDEAIYTGAFWTNIWSSTFDGVYIALDEIQGDYPKVKLKLGYPTATYFTGKDPRSDERILKELELGGFLYEQFEVIGQCKKIVGTGKRHASWFFTFRINSTVKGKFPDSEITFEKFADFGGSKLLTLLEANKGINIGENPESAFNSTKEIFLMFEVQVMAKDPQIISIDYKAR